MFCLLMLCAGNTYGIEIKLYDATASTNGKGIHANQLAFLQKSVNEFEKTLLDNVTVHLGVTIVSFKELGFSGNHQAAFLSHMLKISQKDVFDFLTQDAKSDIDKQAIAALKPYAQSVHFLSIGATKDILDARAAPVLNDDHNTNNTVRYVPSANIKAINPNFKYETYGGPIAKFILDHKEKQIILDGIIYINDDYKFQMEPNWSHIFNHELLGILGLQSSGVVTLQLISLPECKNPRRLSLCFTKQNYADMPFGSITDLFRYSKESAQKAVVDWTISDSKDPNRVPYFSLDKGKTAIVYFAHGNADSREQAGLWSNAESGLNGPLTDKMTNHLSKADLIGLDAIGWDVKVPAGIHS